MKPTAPLREKLQRFHRDALPWLISFSLDLMRSSLIAAILLATTAIALSSPQELFGLWRFVGTSDSRNFSPRGRLIA